MKFYLHTINLKVMKLEQVSKLLIFILEL